MTQSMSAVVGGRRRRTDLIPTMPIHRGDLERSPRPHTSSSRGSVSRSTGMSVSLSRLDQLSRPRRRTPTSGQLALQPLHENADASPGDGAAPATNNRTRASAARRTARPSVPRHSMSKSMSHLPTAKPERKTSVPATLDRAHKARRTSSSGVQQQQPPRPGGTTNGGWPLHARPNHAVTAFSARLLGLGRGNAFSPCAKLSGRFLAGDGSSFAS